MGRHKSDWGAETKYSRQVQLADPTPKNVLFCRGPEWQAQGRESVARIVPERLLQARRSYLRRNSGVLTNGHAPSSWMRNAAASCYFNLQLPVVLRGFRERYQLTRGPGRRVSISKRAEPVARILYYHRVNNNHDPFFPAMSTERFDYEMRHVSRNYNVVSLSELLDRLESRVPGMVMAVTFDDGYADNYTHALPILERYGIPATIYLTTGSLDSREPLWFERLAFAVRNTALEYLDVEIDIPRRFYFRTEPERLQSNNDIYGVLRELSDAARADWLCRIVRDLGTPDASEIHDRMLTWDHVRAMTRRGIEFGGHTVNHPFMSKLPPEQVEWEVSECKRRIEDELQSAVQHFAYPSGREEHFGNWNKQIVRNAGYRSAVTTIWGTNSPSTDLMELRRGGPWEDSPAVFAYKLDWYQMMNG